MDLSRKNNFCHRIMAFNYLTLSSSLLFLHLPHTYAADETTPEQLLLPSPDRYTGLRKFAMEVFMVCLFVVVVRTIIYVRRANRMAWLWRKKSKTITSWDDFREAPGYDMVLPAESTLFDTFFYDAETGDKCFGNRNKNLDMAEYAAQIKNRNVAGIKANAPANKREQLLAQMEQQNWLQIAGQHWMNSVRLGLVMRAKALRPLMYKVDQDYPEMKRMHDAGMCDTATFDAVENAMSMMKAEIKELNELAKEVGYLNQDLSKGLNVWNLADQLLSFGKHMEELNRKKQEENNLKEQEQHKKEKEARKAQKAVTQTQQKAMDATLKETKRIAKAQADLLAEEDLEKAKKKRNSNKRG